MRRTTLPAFASLWVSAAAVLAATPAVADECATLDELASALTAARASVAAAQTSAGSGGDSDAALATARADVESLRTQTSAAIAPAKFLRRGGALRRKLTAARRFVVRAEHAASRSGKAARLLARADASLAKAEALVTTFAATQCDDDGSGGGGDEVVVVNGALGTQQVFPSDNWWNLDVSGRDVAADSDAVIDFIGRSRGLHADFGTDFGIPYVVLGTAQTLSPVSFDYDDESDAGAPGLAAGYPIPVAARTTASFIEGGVAGGGSSGDRHLLLVDTTTNFLYEIFAARWTGSAWTAGSGAVFDLTSNARRPEGWTSADAAGLAIFPGLARADEVFDKGEIRHALRFTVRATKGYVHPASHDATHGAGGDARPPLGLRVRLKAGVDISGFSEPVRVLLTAMKTYGLILADNGSDWFITGAPDPRWDDETIHDEFAQITGDDFEAVGE